MSAPIKVVIVDDEKPARDRLRRLLAAHPDFVLAGEAQDVGSAAALLQRERPDLCLLDVQMPGGDGFDVLRAPGAPRVILTTAHERYAVRAFEINSVDYLLKPFSPARFAAALDKVREQIAREASRAPASERIPVRRGTRIVLLDPAQANWFEAEETLVFALTEEGRFLVDRSLQDLEAALEPAFFRAHRRYLVNVARIAEIRPAEAGTFRIRVKDSAGTFLPLSRRQAKRLRERIPW